MRSGERCAQSSATTYHSRISRALTLTLLILAAVGVCAGQTRKPAPQFKITSVKAMLFYDNTGTFSEDVADDPSNDFTVPSILWNTPLEGASRKGGSTSVFVTVEVSTRDVSQENRSIELSVRYIPLERKRETVERRVHPIELREDGKFIAGFWINQAGCNPVHLVARIQGQTGPAIKKVIRFGCGE